VLQLFHNPKIDFMGKRRMWVGVSLTLIAISFVILGVKGIHKGIEFEGGAEVQLQYAAAPDVGAVREALGKAGFAGSIVTTIGKPEARELYIRVPLVPGAKDQDLAPRSRCAARPISARRSARSWSRRLWERSSARWPACWSTSGSGSSSSGGWRP
jgi:preprotein translocase subunit SecF